MLDEIPAHAQIFETKTETKRTIECTPKSDQQQIVPSEDEDDASIIMNHIGHIGMISDFSWNHLCPWTIISASDDAEPFNQIQRSNDASL